MEVEIAIGDVFVDERLALRDVCLHRRIRGLNERFNPGTQKLTWVDRVSMRVKTLQRCKRLPKGLHRTIVAVAPTGFGFDGGGDVVQ